MGVYDELTASFGEDFFTAEHERRAGHVWNELCPCGHLDRYHAESIGGGYRLNSRTQTVRGEQVQVTQVFGGCVGALKVRGFEEMTRIPDHEKQTMVERINPTCPCDRFRGVAKVDRPNRFFNQRMPADREDPTRHPFQIGLRAFATHLSRRKAAIEDPDWAMAELDRRFVWLDGRRLCAQCKATDGVYPVFVDRDRSELRCPAHR